ncbi:hypothetical protein BGW39_008464 [Mortierella sp. 14UC]|nr:hypothetical protein BGW39_008464 [Mortierella sp. 14UC]
MDTTPHPAKHTLSSSIDRDTEDIDSTDNATKDTEAHRDKRQRTARHVLSTESDQNNSVDDLSHDSNEDDTVLSEVHIHPDNGLVDRRTITSNFVLSRTGHVVDCHQEDNSSGLVSVSRSTPDDSERDKDKDSEDEDDEPDCWDYTIEIKHAMGTDLRGVGSQVWMGCFLLIDWIVHIQEQLSGTVVLEIGAGTGLASIATSLLTFVDRVYCTDYDSDILENCKANIDFNCASKENIKTRRLNWLMDDPFDTVEDDHLDPFAWSCQERQDWKDNGAFILAADVVYDDSLTDALVDCLEKLLADPLPASHPRHYIGRVAYMTMEKRYNFSLDELAVVAQAYEHFKVRIGRSEVIEAEEIDASSLSRHCDYDRTKDLTTIRLPAKHRGCHLVTHEIEKQLPELKQFSVGMANIFLQHTSASLTLNENADPDVRVDMEMALNKIAPENLPYIHTDEGPDDMPGHLKSSLFGVSLNIPITNGRLNLGTWQGIWMCEHRDHASGRKIVVTMQGEKRK